jgi:ribosomal protein S18 acetylase RimI-like enzyme
VVQITYVFKNGYFEAVHHRNLIAEEWLSQIIDRDVYQLVVDDHFITDVCDMAGKSNGFLQDVKRSPVFLYSRVPSHRLDYIKLLEDEGFRLVDTTVTFEKAITLPTKQADSIGVRFATSDDRDQTVALAKRAFSCSRFHLDTAFSKETADAIKGEWVRNYFLAKRGDAMVIAEAEQHIAGFVQLLSDVNGTLIIDLIAVDEYHRRKGIAAGMVAFAESRYGDFERIRVGTQAVNIQSIQFYEYYGFRTISSSYVFHYHYPTLQRRM